MNQLSWLIYLAEVLGNIHCVLVLVGSGLVIMAVVLTIVGAICGEEVSYQSEATNLRARAFKESVWSKVIPCLIASVILFTVSSLVPSKETVYAIAASEMGEQVLKTPTAGKAVKALEAWLDKQIRENTK